MNVVGIVAEYNPFHNGHLYHLRESKIKASADCAVAVMSGNFTQRGDPALLDKWTRACLAVKNGVDLVVELPFVFACNNAEYFAYGAISLLDGLGAVTHLSFGSEHNELSDLIHTAGLLAFETPEFKEALHLHLSKGVSFPKARHDALCDCGHIIDADILRTPNNILAVEYLKQLVVQKSIIRPISITRKGPGYHDLQLSDNMASASAIREGLISERGFDLFRAAVPLETQKALSDLSMSDIITFEDFFPLLLYRIRTTSKERLAEIMSSGEGLENRLKQAVKKARTSKDIIKGIKSRRYTETRIKRLLIHTLIGLYRDDFYKIMDSGIIYARVLAFSDIGAEFLRLIKSRFINGIPVLTNINKEICGDDPIWSVLAYDVLAADIYNVFRHGEMYTHSDHVHKICRIINNAGFLKGVDDIIR